MVLVAAAALWIDSQGWLRLTSTERGAAWIFMAIMVGFTAYMGFIKKWPEQPFVEAALAPKSVQRKRTLLMLAVFLVVATVLPLQVLADRGLVDGTFAAIGWFVVTPLVFLLIFFSNRLNRPF